VDNYPCSKTHPPAVPSLIAPATDRKLEGVSENETEDISNAYLCSNARQSKPNVCTLERNLLNIPYSQGQILFGIIIIFWWGLGVILTNSLSITLWVIPTNHRPFINLRQRHTCMGSHWRGRTGPHPTWSPHRSLQCRYQVDPSWGGGGEIRGGRREGEGGRREEGGRRAVY